MKPNTHPQVKMTFTEKLDRLDEGGEVLVKQYELIEIMRESGYGKFIVRMDDACRIYIKLCNR